MNGEIVPTTTNQFVSGLYSPIPRTALVAIVLIVTIAIARSTMPKGLMVIIGFMIGLLCAPFISNLYWYNGCGLWSDFHTPAAVTTLTMLGLVCMGTIAVAISAKPSQSKEV